MIGVNRIQISIVFILALFCATCQSDLETKPLKIGVYEFDFPLVFEKKDVPGIKNYMTIIKGDGIEFYATYGYYPNDFEFYEKKTERYYIEEQGRHAIIDDTLDNIARRILIAKEPEIGRTGIYLEDQTNIIKEINSYQAMDMYITGITLEQQQMVLRIYKSGRRIR
ncbi:MAG: hypothetical protein GQ574_12385 [Crocinitomix sp.]|nr:hypothetical protein [Crocinitomix sp.]